MMQKKGHNRRKLNNKGLSLVEVLVAMLVLSIASIALLRSFSYAVQLNTKSKENQQTMVLAQSLMESLKAYDVDGLDAQFSSNAASFQIYPLSAGTTLSKTGAGLSARTYTLNNVEFSGSAYDVSINMNPRIEFVKDLATFTTPNRHNDAFFQQEADEKQKLYDGVLQYLIDNYNADPDNTMLVDTSHVGINSREMKLEITDNTVNYYVTYTYSLNNYQIIKDDADATMEYVTESGIVFTIDYATDFSNVQRYNNSDAEMQAEGVTLENIYLYYYPNYKTVAGSYGVPCNDDVLYINNSSSSVKNVYVIRQKDSYMGAPALSTGESDYRLDVNHDGTEVDLYHNIDVSLDDSGHPDFKDTLDAEVENKGTPWEAGVESANLLYDVTINITKHGTSDIVCTLEGTTNAQ